MRKREKKGREKQFPPQFDRLTAQLPFPVPCSIPFAIAIFPPRLRLHLRLPLPVVSLPPSLGRFDRTCTRIRTYTQLHRYTHPSADTPPLNPTFHSIPSLAIICLASLVGSFSGFEKEGGNGGFLFSPFYKMRHFLLLPSGLPPCFLLSSAARVACSKTSRTPSLALAEHSR